MPPGFWQQAIPSITDTLLAVGGDVVRTQVRAALMKSAAPRPMIQEETPPRRHGCPYCAVTRTLAIAHRYLTRASQQVPWGSVYQELALSELHEASQTLLALSASDLDTLRLTHSVLQFEVALSQPLITAAHFIQSATEAWSISDQAITLAERYQATLRSQEALVSEIERAGHDLAQSTNIIDAEARVIG